MPRNLNVGKVFTNYTRKAGINSASWNGSAWCIAIRLIKHAWPQLENVCCHKCNCNNYLNDFPLSNNYANCSSTAIHISRKCEIPYSGKFSKGLIFKKFESSQAFSKIFFQNQ